MDTNCENGIGNGFGNGNGLGLGTTSQNYITTTFVYVNSDNSIDKVISETHTLVEMKLPYSQILHLIQTKKNTPTAKYKLMNILLYSVDLDPTNIEQYAYADVNSPEYNDLSKPFFKIISSYEAIQLNPSIFIFHKVNSVYFVFKEKMRIPPKSILKSGTSGANASGANASDANASGANASGANACGDTGVNCKKTKKNNHNYRAYTKRVNFV